MSTDEKKYYALMNDNEIFINFINVVYGGEKSKRDISRVKREDQLKKIVEARKTNLTNKQIADLVGISLASLSLLVKEYNLPRRKPRGRTPKAVLTIEETTKFKNSFK